MSFGNKSLLQFNDWIFWSGDVPMGEPILLNDKGLTKLPYFSCIKSIADT